MSIEAMKQAWEAEQKANPHTAYNSWCRGYEAALRTAIEQAEKQEPWPEEPAGHKSGGVQPPLQEPVACKHEWFRTGAMEPGECRCIRCGKWSCSTPPAAPYRAVKTVHEGKPVYVSEPAAPVQEPVALPCCGYTDANAVKWNPFNGVVQCHNCGQTYAPPAAQRQWVEVEQVKWEGDKLIAKLHKATEEQA